MMFFLIGDVLGNGINVGWADGKSSISILPMKTRLLRMLVNPDRRGFFEFSHVVGNRLSFTLFDEEVDMIFYAADVWSWKPKLQNMTL